MAIITKRIRGKEYAYLSVREGSRVIQKYLGQKSLGHKPLQFPSYLFWDTDSSKINHGKNATYILERILEMGDIPAIKWLLQRYSIRKITELMQISRNLSPKSKHFWELWFENI